jgi:hypothetical protein
MNIQYQQKPCHFDEVRGEILYATPVMVGIEHKISPHPTALAIAVCRNDI